MAQRTTRMHINFKTNAVNLTMKQPKHDISDAVTLIFSQIYLYSFFFSFIYFSYRPKSGSTLLYSRKKVRYRRDGYCWKKRKDGKTTREDHMKLKVQGIEVSKCCKHDNFYFYT